MKVGTDGLLLGAWASAPQPSMILDIGCGCGLIALMMAQRFPEAVIHAVEPDSDSQTDAAENFQNCPWAARLHIFGGKIQDFRATDQYDLVVCNPPFFNNGLLPTSSSRRNARHTLLLSAADLLTTSKRLLSRDGRLAVIIPFNQKDQIQKHAAAVGLFPQRVCHVRGKSSSPIRRALFQFGQKQIDPLPTDSLIIESRRHIYTPQYAALTSDFLLRTDDRDWNAPKALNSHAH